jgi:hypothetical protein
MELLLILVILWLWFFGGWGWASYFEAAELARTNERMYAATRLLIIAVWPVLSVHGALLRAYRRWMRIGATPRDG